MTRRTADTYTDTLDPTTLNKAWKDTPKTLAEQDQAWDRADRLEQLRANRAAQRTT